MQSISGHRFLRALRFLAFGALASIAAFVQAREKGNLDIALTSSRIEKTLGGDEVRAKATTVIPGDLLEYTAVYSNQGAHALGSLAPTLPIPEGMEYVSGSARPAPTMATLDGKKFEAYPIKRMRQLPNGRTMMSEVSGREYRGFRWNAGDLAPGSHYTVSNRVRVIETVAPAQR